MFKEDDMEYVYVLHPTLQSVIEAKILLDGSNATGKVVIVYMPENVLEQFDLVSVCLMHEAFHVLTQEPRNRKLRYKCFIQSVLFCIQYQIFDNVVFFEDDERQDEIVWERLTLQWFEEIEKHFFGDNHENNEDRFFGESLKTKLEIILRGQLIKICEDLHSVLMSAAFRDDENVSYDIFREHYDIAQQWEKDIRRNILYLLCGNTLWNILDTLMQMYRECYADIACIITLSLEPEIYSTAFKKSVSFAYEEKSYFDKDQILRTLLVARAVKDFVPDTIQNMWQEYSFRIENQYREQMTCEEKNISEGLQRINTCVNIPVSWDVIECYVEYLRECALMFSEQCNHIQGLSEFRKKIKSIIELGNQKCLMQILAGALDIDNIMQEDFEK